MKRLLPILMLFHILIAVAAVNPPSGNISYNSPFCQNSALQSVITNATPGGTFSALPAGLSINANTGDIQPNASLPGTYTVTYTIPATQEDVTFEANATVVIAAMVSPNFAQLATLCSGSTPPALQTTSPNGITGTWSPPVIDNQQTEAYFFTPDSGQCAVVQTLVVNVVQMQPTFTFPSHNLCLGNVPPLPTVSENGIAGTWNPDTIMTTGVYTFTPNAGQCGTTRVETFSVSAVPIATLTGSTTICAGYSAIITFAGTPNSVVTYSVDGASNQTILLNASGTAIISTPVLTSTTIYCLVSVTSVPGNCTVPTNGCAYITVVPEINLMPMPSVTVCDQYTLPVLSIGNYYTETNGGGTMLNAGDVITATQLIYVYTSNICGHDEEYFMVNVHHTIVLPTMQNVMACGVYSLPESPDFGYYSMPHGVGPMISNVYSTQTVYVYAATASTPSCVSEDSFHVTIVPLDFPTITTEGNINYIYVDGNTVVQPLLLDATVSENYSYQWMELHTDIPNATNPTYLVNSLIVGGSHYYSVRITNNITGCATECQLFYVFETPIPAPVGDPNQTFILGQTLADVVVSGSNIQWYDAMNRGANPMPLPLSTVLVEGVTYYATQTINGHESASAFEITIQFLANDAFSFKDLRFSPNPVEDVLHIESKDVVQDVSVYNIMGQKIMQQSCYSLDLRLSLGQLKTGNYFIKLESDNKSQVIKVVKE